MNILSGISKEQKNKLYTTGIHSIQLILSKNRLLKQYNEMYHQHRRKHFPYQEGINIFVSIPVQLH